MYQVDERDKVIELENVPPSSIGAPLPIALSDEHRILLGYIVEDQSSDWDGSDVRVVGPDTPGESLALVEFNSYSTFMFGAPNDEAFSWHPLAKRGLHPYTAFRIEDSSWVRQLEHMNSVHPYHKPERFERLKHFIFAFHDSTFECVAEGFVVSKHEGSLQSLLLVMRDRLHW